MDLPSQNLAALGIDEVKFAAIFKRISLPGLWRTAVAPITATLRGSKNASSFRITPSPFALHRLPEPLSHLAGMDQCPLLTVIAYLIKLFFKARWRTRTRIWYKAIRQIKNGDFILISGDGTNVDERVLKRGEIV
jgi:hypothetical protein